MLNQRQLRVYEKQLTIQETWLMDGGVYPINYNSEVALLLQALGATLSAYVAQKSFYEKSIELKLIICNRFAEKKTNWMSMYQLFIF